MQNISKAPKKCLILLKQNIYFDFELKYDHDMFLTSMVRFPADTLGSVSLRSAEQTQTQMH